MQDAPHPADAIVVIGGDHKPERMQRAAELFQQGYAPVIIISAGTLVLEGNEVMPEAEVMRRQAVKLGLPETVLILEAESQTTVENALLTRRICRANAFMSILLVTSAYHSRRARRIFQDTFGADIAVSVQPALLNICPFCWPLYPEHAYVVYYEYKGWLDYWGSYLLN